jgi:prepilin-type N-terminal cleavage/methylation domain-containing protein
MSRPGFSLIELLVAMVVLAVGILALASTMGYTSRVQGLALARAEMASVAELQMEDFRSRASSRAPAARQAVLAPGGTLDTNATGYSATVNAGSGRQYRVRWRVQPGPVGLIDRLVTVRIMPMIPNRQSPTHLDFQTIIVIGE